MVKVKGGKMDGQGYVLKRHQASEMYEIEIKQEME